MDQVSGADLELMNSVTYVPNKEGIEDFEDLREFVFEVLQGCSFQLFDGVTFEDVGRNPKYWQPLIQEESDVSAETK